MPLYNPATSTGYTPGGTDVAVADGGTGSSTAAGAATNLGLGTGDSPQFTAVNVGAATDTTVSRTGAGDIAVEGNAIYRAGGTDVPVTDGGTGSSTATGAATNLGLGTGDSPQFTAVNIGAATDTTLTRVSAGNIAIEGNALYRAGGTDVPVADGGTGSSTAGGAATNLGLGTGDSPQFTAIELGHASDTTITRVSAGVIAVEGVTIVSGSGVTVQDEGTPLSTTGTTLNFVGAGVAATGSGATKTITVSGGAAAVASDTIWDAAGDLAVGTGADTAHKLAAGTAGQVLVSAGAADPVWTQFPLLGIKVYAPASQTVLSTGSATFADMDATNAVVTFTAPASGNVIVWVSAYADTTSNDYFWGLRESTTNLAGATTRVVRAGTVAQTYCSVPMYLSGLSAGSHTYKLSHAILNGVGTGRLIVQDGAVAIGGWGPLIIKVEAAP